MQVAYMFQIREVGYNYKKHMDRSQESNGWDKVYTLNTPVTLQSYG